MQYYNMVLSVKLLFFSYSMKPVHTQARHQFCSTHFTRVMIISILEHQLAKIPSIIILLIKWVNNIIKTSLEGSAVVIQSKFLQTEIRLEREISISIQDLILWLTIFWQPCSYVRYLEISVILDKKLRMTIIRGTQ